MKKFIISISKLSMAFIITIIAIEIFFRFSEIFLPSIVYDDPKLGILRKPNAPYLSLNEGFGMGSVNEYGYLGPGYPKEKDGNTLRIALIGASIVQGLEVFDRQHFRKLLEDKLSVVSGKKVEVLNFGRGGIDFRGAYTTQKYISSEFHPDINLIFIGGNTFIVKDDKPGPEYQFLNDSLIIDYSFAESSQFKLRTRFKFLRLTAVGNLLKRGYEFYQLSTPGKLILGSLYEEPSVVYNNSMNEIEDPYIEIDSVITKIYENMNKNGNTLNIFVKSEQYSEHYDRIIRNSNIPVFDLFSEFERCRKNGENIDYWKATNVSGHWNHYGHEVVAEFLFDSLKNIKF
jgi:lysophospholipase L1-like esterase